MRRNEYEVVKLDKSNFLREGSTLKQAIERLEKNNIKTIFVLSGHGKLIGTVTDGDVRRCFLNGFDIEEKLSYAMNSNFQSISEGDEVSIAFDIFDRTGINIVPVLCKDGYVIEVLILGQRLDKTSRSNHVLIMAGGRGQRLWPLTKECPKPMLPVNGRPMLEIVIENCFQAGFRNFDISVNYLKEKIMEHFGDGSTKGINIKYLEEEKPLGTAGAIRLLPEETNFPILVTNGDVLTSLDFRSLFDFHQKNKSDLTICLTQHILNVPYGVVDFDGNVFRGIREKPSLTFQVCAGLYVMEKKVIDLIPVDSYYDMPDVIEKAKTNKLNVCVFPMHEKWIDVGLPASFEQAHNEWQ